MLPKYNFHDSHLKAFSLGPRRELTLVIALNPMANPGAVTEIAIRFGAIRNFEEVRARFGKLSLPEQDDRYIEEIVRLEQVSKGQWVFQLENGEPIEIQSSKAEETWAAASSSKT